MARMFLQSDNGGYGVLVTDGEKWYYWSEYRALSVDLDANTNEDNAEKEIERIQKQIKELEKQLEENKKILE